MNRVTPLKVLWAFAWEGVRVAVVCTIYAAVIAILRKVEWVLGGRRR